MIQKLRCWWRHKWTMEDHVKRIPGGIQWTRQCSRCYLHQTISTCYGYAFLDKEWK